MLAVFKTGGKQYSVKSGQVLKVEKLNGNKGDSISFDKVLALTDANNHTVGDPLVKGASIKAKIIDQIRDKKIIVFKKRKRQNYRHTQGHRQYLTVVKIESIALDDKKIATAKKEIKKVDSDIKIPKAKKASSKSKKVVTKKSTTIKKTTKKKTNKE